MPDVIVTGLPRSGLTPVAALVDYLPNAVCLGIPPWPITMNAQSDALSYSKWLTGDFIWKRGMLEQREPVGDYRTPQGAPILDGLRDPNQMRAPSGEGSTVLFTRPDLHGDFIFAQKQHVFFTALLPTLVKFRHFKIIAVIRHPFDVLQSWNSLCDHQLSLGRLPMGRGFWPEADMIGTSYGDTLDKQVQLYELCLQRYYDLKEHIHILKYEDVMEDPMSVSRLFGIDTLSNAAPMLMPRPRVHNSDIADILRDRIYKYGVYTKIFYPEI